MNETQVNTQQPRRNQKNLTTKTRRREEILCDSSRLRVFVVQISLVAPQKQEPTNSFVPGLDLSLQAALRP